MGTNEERRPILRSIHTHICAVVKFVNTTSHHVKILWINYEGQAVSFGQLDAGKSRGVVTFATHPWIFVEAQTMDRFMVNGKDVYYPVPWAEKHRDRQTSPTHINVVSDTVYITLPMYTLRDIALRTIKLLLCDDKDAYRLDIPKDLQRELANTEPRKNTS